METRLADIINKVAKAEREIEQGVIYAVGVKEHYEELSYLLTVIHQKNERIAKLERIIIEDRINTIDQ